MEEYYISKSRELFDLLHDFKDGWSWIFRGQENASWNLLPRAGRAEFRKVYSKKSDEKQALNSWKRYAAHYLSDPPTE